MPDISMCNGRGCKRRDTCYRHRAIPSSYQSWFMPMKDTGECDAYWNIGNRTNLRTVEQCAQSDQPKEATDGI